jgi:Tfp pilus assembly protein PilN
MEDNKVKVVEGQNSLLVYGIIYIVVLALAIWLIYGFRFIQINQANSKIDSIKKQITTQISEDELGQLETISGQLATLYGRPFVTTMFKNIAAATPKNTVLSGVNFSDNQITIQGTAPSYNEVSLFTAALNQNATNLQNVEIANASQSSFAGQTGVSFTLQANLK